MVTFVDNYLPILADQIADTLAGGEALDHGYIDAPRRFLPAAADLSHFLGAEPQEALKLGAQLVQEGLAVHEHQGVHPPKGGHVGPQHRLSGTGRSHKDPQVEGLHDLHGLLLHGGESALECPFDGSPGIPLLFHHQPAAQISQDRLVVQVGEAAVRALPALDPWPVAEGPILLVGADGLVTMEDFAVLVLFLRVFPVARVDVLPASEEASKKGNLGISARRSRCGLRPVFGWSNGYDCSFQPEDLLLGGLDLADLVCKPCFQGLQAVAQIDTIRGVRLHDSMVRLSPLFCSSCPGELNGRNGHRYSGRQWSFTHGLRTVTTRIVTSGMPVSLLAGS